MFQKIRIYHPLWSLLQAQGLKQLPSYKQRNGFNSSPIFDFWDNLQPIKLVGLCTKVIL